jgi:hypothetical protein
MKKLTLASLSTLAAVALIAAGCGADTSTSSKAAPGSAQTCPAAWRTGWQKLANQIDAPVYCPSWMPKPLDGQIGGPWANGRFVDPDRSYLVSFVWQDTSGGGGSEVHVNFRGYPGHTAIPTCEDTLTVKGKTVHPKIPCFADPRGRKRFGPLSAIVFTANQGVDTWHVLYAWRYHGALFTVSEHVAPPYGYKGVVANLDRMMRGLVLLTPSR